jgi:hypothetical protein
VPRVVGDGRRALDIHGAVARDVDQDAVHVTVRLERGVHVALLDRAQATPTAAP